MDPRKTPPQQVIVTSRTTRFVGFHSLVEVMVDSYGKLEGSGYVLRKWALPDKLLEEVLGSTSMHVNSIAR